MLLILYFIFSKQLNIYSRIGNLIITLPLILVLFMYIISFSVFHRIIVFLLNCYDELYILYIIFISLGACAEYSKDKNSIVALITLIAGIAFDIFILINYSKTIIISYSKNKLSLKDLHHFIIGFLGSITAFVNLYCIAFIYSQNAFTGIDTTSTLSIFVDIYLFAVQIFSLQTIVNIVPNCTIAKTICLIEMLFFTFFIVIIVLNIIGNKLEDGSKK